MKNKLILLLIILFSITFFSASYINTTIVNLDNSPVIRLNDGGQWSCDRSLQFPVCGYMGVVTQSGSYAYIHDDGTWSWFIRTQRINLYGMESEVNSAVDFDYDKFKSNKSFYYGKTTIFDGEVLQTRQESNGYSHIVVNPDLKNKGSYEKSTVIRVTDKNVNFDNLPKPSTNGQTRAVFRGWTNYRMNCGTVRFVPLFLLDPTFSSYFWLK